MTEAPRFVPWALPLAGGTVAGVVVAALFVGTGAAVAVGVATTVIAAARRRPWVVLVAVGMAAGGVRMGVWQARPDRLAELMGEARTFDGVTDGSALRLDEPRGLRLALVPAGSLPAGRVRVIGRAVRAPGRRNPGGFDLRGYLERRGVEGQLRIDRVVAARPVTGVLERFRRGVTRGLGTEQAALMQAMTLGVRDDLGALRQRFASAGLAHVLALSGLHVGVLVAALGRALSALGRRRYPVLAAATVGYVALVGPSPSVVRAALMVLAGLAGLAAGRGRMEPWPALALAATGSLLLAPAQLLDASFQLSYLAVAGMLVFVPPLTRLLLGRDRSAAPARRRDPRRWLVTALVASTAAQLPSLSLVAGSFGRVPLVSPLVNLVAVPLAGVLVPLGMLAALAGLIVPQAAALVNGLVGPLASVLLALARLGERLPHLTWPEVSPLGHACFAIVLLAVALAAHGRLRLWRALLVACTAGTVSAAVPPAHAPPEAVFLDVGQGDATLLRFPGHIEVLVDGGGTPFSDRDVGEQIVLPALRALGVTALELVVATHADLDHVEGLVPVLEQLPVGTLVMGPSWPDAAIDRRLRAVAARRGVPVHQAVRGERYRIGRGAGAPELEVLHPGPRALPTTNETSVALLLRQRGIPQLLMLGDAPASVERTLAVPRVPILKVAHHGSRFSTSEALVRATTPAVAVVSVGENRYGHPDAGVVERLLRAGSRVETTLDGGALRSRLPWEEGESLFRTVPERP